MQLHLDFETFSEADLKKAGADVYVHHPSTEVLLTSWAAGFGEIHTEEGHPVLLEQFLRENQPHIYAFNAQFERLVLWHLLNIRYPIEKFVCVQAWAYHLSFAHGLDDVGKQVGLPRDKAKIAEGRRLLQRFCKPRKPSKNNDATRWTKENDPDNWASFIEYNRQDVVAERELTTLFSRYPMSQFELDLYKLDQEINDRGWPVDTELVDSAVQTYNAEANRLRTKLAQVTGVENPNSVVQLREWLALQGVELPDLTKTTVRDAVDRVNGAAQEALKLRQQLARSTPKKWHALKKTVRLHASDPRLRYTLQFAGASRTSRWSGRVFQPHNLARPNKAHGSMEELASLITYGPQLLECFHGSVIDPLVSAIRSAICAPDGKKLVVADLSSIESRLLGWLTGCERINRVFAEGRDTYRDFAAALFGVPEGDITKEQRDFCKPPVLGCGYMLSPKGLVKYAADLGVEISLEQAERMVSLFRSLNWEVTRFWEWIEQAVMYVTANPTEVVEGYRLRVRRDDKFLMVDLPSRRTMYYYHPTIEMNRFGKPAFSYMGIDQYTNQWQRLITHPGKLTENFIQAIARDVLAWGMLRYNATRYRNTLDGHVHDEAVTEAFEEEAADQLQTLIDSLKASLPWAPGLLLDAEGYIAERFRKG